MSENSNNGRDAAWRAELRSALTAKERTAIQRAKMPMLDPQYRITNNEEVNQGLTAVQAHTEATRCLDCPEPTCVQGCPVNIDIPGFIKNLQHGNVNGAYAVLRRTSALPAVCGRVCPQEKQCESHCIYNKMKKAPVAIGWLERYVADNSVQDGQPQAADNGQTTEAAHKAKIAVVGSGPAGLSFAGDMASRGYHVEVFEALHKIGGVLIYGIPEFRLPNSVVERELNALKQAGVQFHTNTVIGKTLSYDDLIDRGFKGIFVASGAGLPRFMGIPGEDLIGVMSSNEYLTRINLMGAGHDGADTPIYKGRHVAVIGGGNTAMDSVRTALRMGAEKAFIVYRRSRAEMPARAEEVTHAMEEGVEFMELSNPIEYLGDERGHVTTMRIQRMELGEPDASGRRRPVPIPGAIDNIDVDQVIVSIGVSPNPLVPNSIKGLEVTAKGTLCVDDTLKTSLPMLYAGGDIVRGGATVILAMGDGRRAAASMAATMEGNN